MRKVICSIYGLYSTKEPNRLRYVGQTVQPLKKRLSNHKAHAKFRKHAVSGWIRKHTAEGYEIKIKLLAKGIMNQTEVRMLKEFKDKGYKLLNQTNGGEGALGHRWKLSKEDCERRSVALRGNSNMLGKKLSQETRDRMSVAKKKLYSTMEHPTKGIVRDEAYKLMMSEACKGIKKSFSTRLKMKQPKSEEHKLKLKEAALRRWALQRGNNG